MTGLNFSFILAVSFLFYGCMGAEAKTDSTVSRQSGSQSARCARRDIVGGTPFPDMYHYEDPVTRSEVWGVRSSSSPGEKPSAPPLYIAPEINIPWPGTPPRPRGGRP